MSEFKHNLFRINNKGKLYKTRGFAVIASVIQKARLEIQQAEDEALFQMLDDLATESANKKE